MEIIRDALKEYILDIMERAKSEKGANPQEIAELKNLILLLERLVKAS